MNDWFTIEQIDPNTYAISEYWHWEQAHSYLVLGHEKAVLIDTGLGVENIGAVVKSLTNLPIQVITTHVHWDHIGGHKYFEHFGVHEKERNWICGGFPIPLGVVKSNLMKELCEFPDGFNVDMYTIFQGKPNLLLHDGDVVDLGNRSLTVLHTPGHSPGHICLHEEATGYLFSGDLIYGGKLDAFYPSTDPIAFMNSVKKVSMLTVSRILPGHYSLELPVLIISEIGAAFTELYEVDRLIQGHGIFSFGQFSIHI